jgi:hypothetical protein
MINDDNTFDELLRNAAQDYNRPPAIVPRDTMWEAIESARAERAVRPLHVVSRTTSRPLTRYAWLGAAAAAVLLVATGVGIGRWSTLRTPASVSSGKSEAVASNGVSQSATPKSNGISSNAEVGAGTKANGEQAVPSPEALTHVGRANSAKPIRSEEVRVADRGVGTRPGYESSSGVSSSALRQEVPYQVATIHHLANAEALLTAFHADSRDAKMDAQLSAWARDLLSNTRLLLDSPAADDPQRARLLGDLELVLAQIVQLSPGAATQDRRLIEGSIQSAQVMTRLRSAIPAGPTRGL